MAQQYAPATVEDGRVEIDGVEVHYLTAGSEGAAIILVHGIGLDSAKLSWEHTIPALSDTYHVFAPDLPGHGESDTPTAPYSIAYYADVIERFMDALNIDHATLVGQGIGGRIALECVLRDETRVDRLVLVDPIGLTDDVPGGRTALLGTVPGIQRLRYRLLGRSRRLTAASLRRLSGTTEWVTPEFVDDVRAAARRPGAERVLKRFRRRELGPRGFRTSVENRLTDVSVPTLLIHGRHDSIVPVTSTIRARSLLPDAELRIVDCGHWPPREWPEEFSQILGEYLAATADVERPA